MFLAKDQNPYPFTYIIWVELDISFLYRLYYLIAKVKFILSSISNG